MTGRSGPRLSLAVLAACSWIWGGGTAHGGRFPEIEVKLDGKVRTSSSDRILIPSTYRSCQIKIGGDVVWPGKNREAKRFRYWLEGYDQGWQARVSDMGLKVRFENSEGDSVDEKYFFSAGESPGWTGKFENSPTLRKRETMEVPPGADRISLTISSAGPPDAIGCYFVSDLTLFLKHPGQAFEKIFATTVKPGDPRNIEPNDWQKEGTHPSMSHGIALEGLARSSFGLAVIDDDPVAHAEWYLPPTALPMVHAGDLVVAEWDTMYSTGLSDKVVVDYNHLPAGKYRFCVETLDALGNTEEKRFIGLVVYTPWWLQLWALIGAGAGFLIAAIYAVRALIRRRVAQRVRQLQQEHLVERERLRIARDIHDDLGARLTHISLVSGGAFNGVQSLSDAKETFGTISKMTRDLVAALYETVWTVDPENDNLEALINHLGQLIENLCDSTQLSCRIQVNKIDDLQSVSSDVRHHISLIVKEAVNNAIKYSGASEITARFTGGRQLEITITDNGRGFDQGTAVAGNGLKNMRRRAEIIGAQLAIQCAPGSGCTIKLIATL